ncbi:MAG: DMT family transporter [Pseudomonadota bacterium]
MTTAPNAGQDARAARHEWIWLTLLLMVLGAGWGVTQPMAKIAVSEGYRHLGILFWQQALGAVFLGAICAARRLPLRRDRAALLFYLYIALIGSVLPGIAGYEAARFLPSGWLSLLLSTVPLFAFPIALALGIDRFAWARFAGLSLGLGGVALLAAPWSDSGAGVSLIWIGVALIPPFLYAIEGNSVAKFGTAGLDPVQLLFGASLTGAVITAPLAVATGTWIDPRPPWNAPDGAIVVSSMVHALVYASYVWLVGRAGSVFAAQVSYLVTGFGVMWAILLLGESYGAAFWGALTLMLAGMTLVRPRTRRAASA